MNGINERLVIIGVFAVAIIAACCQEWATAGLAISGGLAFLKGGNHEKIVDPGAAASDGLRNHQP